MAAKERETRPRAGSTTSIGSAGSVDIVDLDGIASKMKRDIMADIQATIASSVASALSPTAISAHAKRRVPAPTPSPEPAAATPETQGAPAALAPPAAPAPKRKKARKIVLRSGGSLFDL